MHEDISLIVRMFPEFKERIYYLYQNDENFQDICHDYILCASNVKEMKKQTTKNSAHLQEYKDLKKSLKQEISQLVVI
jgi:uncharacterized protein YdcH (DUF465 family)